MKDKLKIWYENYKKNNLDFLKYKKEFRIKISKNSGTSIYIIQKWDGIENEIRISEHNTNNKSANRAVQITLKNIGEIIKISEFILDEYYLKRKEYDKFNFLDLTHVQKYSYESELKTNYSEKEFKNEKIAFAKNTNELNQIRKISMNNDYESRYAIFLNKNTNLEVIINMKNDSKWFNNAPTHLKHKYNKFKNKLIKKINLEEKRMRDNLKNELRRNDKESVNK